MDQWRPEKVAVKRAYEEGPIPLIRKGSFIFAATAFKRSGIFERNKKQLAFRVIDGRIHATVSRIEGMVSFCA